MAADLAATPDSGLRVQLCGDAHLSNFGVFAAPDRRLVFDLNDFDETLPGPFEWDVKRFAASLAVAGRDIGFTDVERRDIVLAGVGSYRTSMAAFTEKSLLDVWYARLDVEDVLATINTRIGEKAMTRTRKALAKARTRDSMQALTKLTTVVDGRRRIISQPPLVVPVEELAADLDVDELYDALSGILGDYTADPVRRPPAPRRAVPARRRGPQGRRRGQRRAPGRGSCSSRPTAGGSSPVPPGQAGAAVGARRLLRRRSSTTTRASVSSRGQHLMQAASDIFLGWQRVHGLDGRSGTSSSASCATGSTPCTSSRRCPAGLRAYAQLCGWTLARAHARSGDRFAIAGYLGQSDRFDRALADFAEAYADRTEARPRRTAAAVDDGRVEAVRGL